MESVSVGFRILGMISWPVFDGSSLMRLRHFGGERLRMTTV